MLLYNFRKEFIGVDENTLKKLGYNTLSELREDVADFADLFDNRPGLIHNFKNFSWIDFILHNENNDSKANIRCNGKIYSCNFKIENFFLTKEDEDRAFAVSLVDIMIIGDDDGSQPRVIKESFEPPMPDLLKEHAEPKIEMPLDTPIEEAPTRISMPEFEISEPAIEPIVPLEVDMGYDEPFETVSEPEPIPAPIIPTKAPSNISSENLDIELNTPSNYVYNPSVAADELGLPADLIDEFVEDFVVQAHKFRPELEEAIAKEDFDNLQILSHKLKGVAANLRIEDALEVLIFLNTSKDTTALKKYLDYLFVIVDKLNPNAEHHTAATETSSAIEEPKNSDEDDDLYAFDLLLPTENSDTASSEEAPHSIDMDEELAIEPIEALEIGDDEPLTIEADEFLPELDDDENKHFDIHQASQALDMPLETLKSYINDFVDQANSLKSELEEALMSKNLDTVQQLATQLKGISQTLHMEYATELLSTLQTTQDPAEAIESAKQLFNFIREL